jgi:hypothetical protein
MVMLGAWPVLPFLRFGAGTFGDYFCINQEKSTFFDLIVSEGDRVQLKKRIEAASGN